MVKLSYEKWVRCYRPRGGGRVGVSQVSRRFEDRREPYVGFRDVGIRLDPVGESAFGGKGRYITWQ
jgi:hypothetical protein